MRKTFLALALTASMFTAQAVNAEGFTAYKDMPAGVYDIDHKHASLTWKISHAGLSNYTARFKSIDAEIQFDPAHPDKSKVTATIDPLSLETDFVPNAERDFNKELRTDEKWFNAGKFPKITFTSTKVELNGENKGKIYGDLTLLGVTKPVVLDVVLNGAYLVQPFNKKPTLGFSATTSIQRTEWGLTTYAPIISDKVDIIIEAEFNQNK